MVVTLHHRPRLAVGLVTEVAPVPYGGRGEGGQGAHLWGVVEVAAGGHAGWGCVPRGGGPCPLAQQFKHRLEGSRKLWVAAGGRGGGGFRHGTWVGSDGGGGAWGASNTKNLARRAFPGTRTLTPPASSSASHGLSGATSNKKSQNVKKVAAEHATAWEGGGCLVRQGVRVNSVSTCHGLSSKP